MTQLEKSKEWTEIQIKVPWGHIAGKWWGPQSTRPIIALHGWQDNAGTFDTLAPLLQRNISLLAIDFTGHGLSSRLPDGMVYHLIDYVYLIRLIMSNYNWNKISIMGHSLGSVVGFLFASMFPDNIDLLIGIDALQPAQIPLSNFTFGMSNILNGSQLADERNRSDSEPPSYSYDECIEKLYVGSGSTIDQDKCPYILTRNIKKSSKYPDKYFFIRDSRIKKMYNGFWPKNLLILLAAGIKKPYLYIKASDSIIINKESYMAIIAMLKKNPLFEYYEVEGRHHVHLNDPEKVDGIINNFLQKYEYMPRNTNIESKL